jgi:hypothetical protein
MKQDYFDLGAIQKELVEYHRRKNFSDPEDLLDFIEGFWGLRLPRVRVCPDHTPPAQYLVDAFFERSPDAICWANRGGGKTLLGALVTWLDTVFKVGCATKVLGGSLAQSKRMYEHLTGEGDGWGLVNGNFHHLLRGEILAQRTVLNNLSNIQILTASSKSVRGTHPQKLKLDEVDEMDPRIYEAALSIPMTKGGHRASTHIYSTMHKTYGLMQTVVEEAPAGATGYTNGASWMSWSAVKAGTAPTVTSGRTAKAGQGRQMVTIGSMTPLPENARCRSRPGGRNTSVKSPVRRG